MNFSDIIRQKQALARYNYAVTNVLSQQSNCVYTASPQSSGCAQPNFNSYEDKQLYNEGSNAYIVPIPSSPAANSDSILTFARALYNSYKIANYDISPRGYNQLQINSQAVGFFEFTYLYGNKLIKSNEGQNWFTSTKDTVSSWIIVNGDLNLTSGYSIIPSARKLFTVLYVKGDLTVNGTISMTARGANHSGTGDSGGFTAPVNIRIGTGTFSSISNPQVPSTGGAGGSGSGVSGTAGTSGGSGGGGSGLVSAGTSGDGASGTSFSGGSGGGGGISGTGNNGTANGGAGGTVSSGTGAAGTGNPTGGTGGTLIIICEGTLSGSGTIVSNGSNNTTGGASGGGSVTVLYKYDGNLTPTNTGGTTSGSGGAGGAGSARKLAIGAN